MSKQLEFPEDDLPPPYSTSADGPLYPPASPGPSTASSLFSSHLAGIRSQISAEQAARTSAREQRDSHILSLIVPHIEELLSSISSIHPPPTLVETTLVPDAAVEKGWQFSDDEEKRRGEVRQVIRIGLNSKLVDKGSREQADYPIEPTLWWTDEGMARRLSQHLQPSRPDPAANQIQAPTTAPEAKKAGRWGFFKKESSSAPPAQSQAARPTPESQGDGVTMAVKSEEVTFRKENDFGLWETQTGWGIVVRVRIRQ